MLRKFVLGALVSLSVSSSAFAMGWHCNDSGSNYWKFHADAGVFTGDIDVVVPASTTGYNGRYWNVVMNTSWEMNIGGAQYLCLTADQGQGKIYTCTTKVPGSLPVNLFNCEGGLFD